MKDNQIIIIGKNRIYNRDRFRTLREMCECVVRRKILSKRESVGDNLVKFSL